MASVHLGGHLLARTRLFLLVALLGLLGACSSSTTLHPGTVVVTMSSTNGGNAFDSYIVQLDAIYLTADNGSVVTLSASPQTVDLVNLSRTIDEVVSAGAIPYGNYVSASLLLDYTYAQVWVDNKGVPTQATLQTSALTAIATVSFVVTFDKNAPLVVNLNQSTGLHINFDLAAFNSIDLATAVLPTVTVQPYVTLAPVPLDTKQLVHARGLWVTLDDAAVGGNGSSFIMNVRPFYSLSSALGALIVTPSADCYFNVNGVTYTGAAGLAAIGALPVNTSIAMVGTLTSYATITPTFTATQVYAGTAQDDAGYDVSAGTVSAVNGDTITLHGVDMNTVQYNLSTYLYTNYYASMDVTVGPLTIVSEDGVAATGLSTKSISVGQQVVINGVATVDASTGYVSSVDATNTNYGAVGSQVRLQTGRDWGDLISATPTTATFDLAAIGIYTPNAFNFTGTNSDKSAYVVNTGGTDLSASPAGTLFAIDGMVTPFGSAPPDFLASSLTNAAATLQQLVIEWTGEEHPFTSIDATGLVPDLSRTTITTIHDIYTGPAVLNLKSLATSPLITTTGAPDPSTLQLSVGSTTLTTGISMYASYAAFYPAVNDAFNGVNKIFRLQATGYLQRRHQYLRCPDHQHRAGGVAAYCGEARDALETTSVHARHAGAGAEHRRPARHRSATHAALRLRVCRGGL